MQNIWNIRISYILLIDVAIWQMSTSDANVNDSVTGHIISTTIGRKNGKPKQVFSKWTPIFPVAYGIKIFLPDYEFFKKVTWICKCCEI